MIRERAVAVSRYVHAGAAADRYLAGAMVALLGAGAVLALTGAVTGRLPLAIAGGGLGWLALTVILAGRWLDPMLVVAMSIPLPAVFSGDGVRVATAAPVTAAALTAWMLDGGPFPRRFRIGELPIAPLALLGFVCAVAAAASSSPFLAARELANLFLLLLLLVAAAGYFVERPEARPRVAEAIALLGVGCGALAVLETLRVIPGQFPRYETPYQRAALGFGQPNGLGLFLAIALPLVAWRAGVSTSGRGRALWRAGLAVTALGLLGTFSRGAWAAVIAGAAVLAFAGEWRRAARIVGGAAIAVVLLDLASGGMVRDTIARTIGDWIIEQRAALVLAGVLMFLDHPLLGVGPGGFESQLDQYGIVVPQLFDFQPTPHNAYVQWAAETGVAGLLVYLVFVYRVGRVGARVVRAAEGDLGLARCLFWAFGVLLVSGFFIWPYAHGTGQAAILLIALMVSAPRPTAREAPP